MPDPNELTEYLGDGVHARFDGETIWLMAEREELTMQVAHVMRVDRIGLSSIALESLYRFADRVWPVNVPEDVAT